MQMGMKGAAMATVIGSLITSLVLLTHFIKKKNRIKICTKGISFDMVKKIISCGSSSFLMEVASGFVIFIFNIQILKYIEDNGIVIYGIISNCIIVGISLFNGIAQASQPIIATNHGADEVKRVRNVLKYAMYTTIAIGIILFAIVFVFTKEVILVFVKPETYFKRAKLKPYIIEHDLKDIAIFSEENELKENRIITLGKFDKGIFINPHNFGEVKNLSKNEITTFVTVGKIEAKRKNFNKLIESLNTLIDKRQNFHVIIIGMGKIKTIPKRLRPYIKITGRLNFPKMYKNLESADFFLPLLDPDVKEHERYITTGVTGSAQLIYGFTKIPVIDQKFAGFYRFNDKNAIVYDHDLASAMEKAINMTAEEYNEKQSKLTETVNLIAKESMDNLKRILNYENK